MMASIETAGAGDGLTIEPITWNVIGLKSNKVDLGPNVFPVGARVCNQSESVELDVDATFAFTEATNSGFISLVEGSPSTISLGDIDPGARRLRGCLFQRGGLEGQQQLRQKSRLSDLCVSEQAERRATTPSNRELFVERLVEQSRNTIASINGPNAPQVGSTVEYTLVGSTAPGGYEQLEAFIDFPNNIFRVVSVETTYSTGGSSDRLYADPLRLGQRQDERLVSVLHRNRQERR